MGRPKSSWQTRAVEYLQRLKGKTRPMKYYRCGGCRTRQVLNKELWQYLRPPRCRDCGVVDWCIDLHRTREHRTKTGAYKICRCDCVWYPHKPASTPWCEQHPTGPTDEEYDERHGKSISSCM